MPQVTLFIIISKSMIFLHLILSHFSEWMEVRGGQYKNLHLETQELQVKTDSALNSEEVLTVPFFSLPMREISFKVLL